MKVHKRYGDFTKRTVFWKGKWVKMYNIADFTVPSVKLGVGYWGTKTFTMVDIYLYNGQPHYLGGADE